MICHNRPPASGKTADWVLEEVVVDWLIHLPVKNMIDAAVTQRAGSTRTDNHPTNKRSGEPW